MPGIDITQQALVVEVVPENAVAEFSEELVTVSVANGTPLVEFPGFEGGGGGGGDDTTSTVVSTDGSVNITVTVEGTNTEYDLAAAPSIDFATREETDAGVITDKALNPDVGAYAYDRFRYPGQHEAGKGTAEVQLTPVAGVVTIDPQLSNVFELLLEEDVTVANTTGQFRGQVVNILCKQDATGGHTIVFGNMWTFVNRVDPAMTPDANACDMFSCQWDITSEKWRCTQLPNYGVGYESPESTAYANVGEGAGVYRDTTVVLGQPTANLRSIVGAGDILVTQNADDITISYSGVAGATELDGLTDVDLSGGASVGSELVFDGEYWVPRAPRQWPIMMTWTNGSLPIAPPVNSANVVVAEACTIVGVYILTQGGTGSCSIDIRKTNYAGFPPTISDSIVASSPPLITGDTKYYDTLLTDWTVDLAAGDILQFVLSSSSTFTVINVVLILQRAVA